MGILRDEAQAFDKGNEEYARPLSMSLRILLLKSSGTDSLLDQMGLGKYLKMLNTAESINPKNLLPSLGFVGIGVSPDDGRYYAPLGEHPPFGGTRLMRLEPWLTQPIGKKETHQWSRQDLVCWVANTDGGGHLDPSLDKFYYELSRENGIGFTFTSNEKSAPKPLKGDYVMESIRQITYEVDMTVIRHVNQGDIPQV